MSAFAGAPAAAQPGTTLHLTPVDVWERQAAAATYVPEAFAADGFIHCTDGEANLLAVANARHRADPRPCVVLTIAVDRVTAPIRYEAEDRAHIYPHIVGPLNRDAVVAVRRVARAPDGSFVRLEVE